VAKDNELAPKVDAPLETEYDEGYEVEVYDGVVEVYVELLLLGVDVAESSPPSASTPASSSPSSPAVFEPVFEPEEVEAPVLLPEDDEDDEDDEPLLDPEEEDADDEELLPLLLPPPARRISTSDLVFSDGMESASTDRDSNPKAMMKVTTFMIP
jgi:hypothetical protein